jgi:hydroxylamine reductase
VDGWSILDRHLLFMTITNANFDDAAPLDRIKGTLKLATPWGPRPPASGVRDLKPASDRLPGQGRGRGRPGPTEGDRRSLVQLLVIGLKGLAAYLHHAEALGKEEGSSPCMSAAS